MTDSTPAEPAASGQSATPVVPWNELPEKVQQRWHFQVTKIALPPLISDAHTVFENAEEFDPRQLANYVSRDPLLGAKLLAVANSAAMGLSNPVTTFERAIVTLGYSVVQSIIVVYYLEATLKLWPAFPRAHFNYVRRISAASAVLASAIATGARLRSVKLLGTAALLARLGSLVLGLSRPWPDHGYRQVSNEVLRAKYEMDKWGISTPVLSAQLLTHWGIPQPLPQLLERHLEPLFLMLEPGAEDHSLLVLCAAVSIGTCFVHTGQFEPFTLFDRYAYDLLKQNLKQHKLWDAVVDLAGDKRLKRELAVVTD